MSAETAAILDKAADVIRRNGWHQSGYYNRRQQWSGRAVKDCSVCARGAINLVADGGNPLNDFSIKAVAASNALLMWLWSTERDGHYAGIASWNDDPDRTAEDVIAALESAAQAEREASS